VEPQMMPPQFQGQPNFQHIQHIRQHTPSASPPIPNGVFNHMPQRQHTPGPQHPGSRPSSRNANIPRRQSSLVPQQQQQQQQPHPAPTNGYAFMPNPAIYNPQNGQVMPPQHLPQHMQQQQQQHPMQAPMQGPPMQGPPQGIPQQAQGPQYPNYGPPPQQYAQQQQVQQIQAEEQRRNSMPPAFPQQERPQSRPTPSPPQPQQQQLPILQHQPQMQSPPQITKIEPEEEPQPVQQQMLNPPKRMSVKDRSIFTPIDESRSILSQHWASSTSNAEPSRADMVTSNNRSQSVDVGAVSRNNAPKRSPPPPQRAQTHTKNRNTSMSSMSSVPEFPPPSRTNSAKLGGGRPILKVQIPPDDKESNDGSATAGSSSSPSGTNTNSHHRNGTDSHSSGVVLPPPSPSASAIVSAGASGPPNPFARPHPVSQPSQNSNASGNRDLIETTPVSALPSRFMQNEFLPSPSSFFASDWTYRGSDSNTLPSPLNFATPVVGQGPSFLREDSGERNGKRKTPEAEEGGVGGGGGGDYKRAKLES
jgi:MADS-box transcription factor